MSGHDESVQPGDAVATADDTAAAVGADDDSPYSPGFFLCVHLAPLLEAESCSIMIARAQLGYLNANTDIGTAPLIILGTLHASTNARIVSSRLFRVAHLSARRHYPFDTFDGTILDRDRVFRTM